MANAPARNAPDDSPKKWNRCCPVSRTTTGSRGLQILDSISNIGIALASGRSAVAFEIHRPDVKSVSRERIHQRIFAVPGTVRSKVT